MRLFTWIIMTCYIVLFILLGVGLMVFAAHGIPVDGTVLWLEMAYTEQNLRWAIGLIGAGLVLLNVMYLDLTLSKLRRQKTIAIENPDGQVTVSLTAIEDFIRRSAHELPEVKELRCDVVARKGRIVVSARATLWSGTHIPEAAERIQSVVKAKVQEMLSGLEEPIVVRVHVSKIAQREERAAAPDRRPTPPYATPYRGF